MSEPTIVDRVQIGRRVCLRVAWESPHGRAEVFVRCEKLRDGATEPCLTNGIAVAPAHLNELISALTKARDQALERGLIHFNAHAA